MPNQFKLYNQVCVKFRKGRVLDRLLQIVNPTWTRQFVLLIECRCVIKKQVTQIPVPFYAALNQVSTCFLFINSKCNYRLFYADTRFFFVNIRMYSISRLFWLLQEGSRNKWMKCSTERCMNQQDLSLSQTSTLINNRKHFAGFGFNYLCKV